MGLVPRKSTCGCCCVIQSRAGFLERAASLKLYWEVSLFKLHDTKSWKCSSDPVICFFCFCGRVAPSLWLFLLQQAGYVFSPVHLLVGWLGLGLVSKRTRNKTTDLHGNKDVEWVREFWCRIRIRIPENVILKITEQALFHWFPRGINHGAWWWNQTNLQDWFLWVWIIWCSLIELRELLGLGRRYVLHCQNYRALSNQVVISWIILLQRCIKYLGSSRCTQQ